MVEVDVVVRDKKGPVEGLTKADFTLQDDGKKRPIELFSVTVARRGSAATGKASPGSLEVPRAATVLLIDRLNTPIEHQIFANQRIIRYLQTRSTNDPLGIYVLGSSLQVIQELTADPARLERAAKGLRPQDARRSTTEAPSGATGDAITDQMAGRMLEELEDFIVLDRALTTRDALLDVARRLKEVPGRKNLVWVSASFPLFTMREHRTVDMSDKVSAAAQALTDANVAVYPVDARGLGSSPVMRAEQTAQPAGGCLRTGEPCLPPPQDRGGPSGIDTMNTLATLTGGQAFYNTNGIEDSIQRAVEDAEVTYTLGFYPPPATLDGTFHRLTVKVAGRGRDVRSRRGYIATKESR